MKLILYRELRFDHGEEGLFFCLMALEGGGKYMSSFIRIKNGKNQVIKFWKNFSQVYFTTSNHEQQNQLATVPETFV